uniref:Putative mitochondrial protein n=1 Tax=Tanacetum cinerariifolium TaxID=118510 RepID=A0A6L2JAT2_TANCI|nr:putative mitochondrial protein [Tanacetum cinerariifolium]
MALTFADTHNMIAYLIKSDASEGFEQILDFLNAIVINYALTVLITEDTVRQALRSDNAESIDCLPNEEIFVELARMGYEKPSTKLTFYKAFSRLNGSRKFNFSKYIFDSLVRNVDSSLKFYMYPRFLQLMIAAQVGDLTSHTTKYTSSSVTQKVFANIRRVGKRFSRVETPLFEGMLVPQQAADDVANVAADDVDGVVDDVVDDVVAEDVVKPTLPSPTPTITPLPSQELLSTSHVAPTRPLSPIAPPSSPPQQLQPSQTTTISMELLNNLLETCTALTRSVENLKQDKIAEALKIIKLKQRVKRLEKKKKLKVYGLKRLKKVGTTHRVESFADTVMDVQGRLEEPQSQVYHIDLEHADKVLSMQDDEPEPAELKEVIEVVTTAKLMTEVVTATTTITAAIITAAPSAARRRKRLALKFMVESTSGSRTALDFTRYLGHVISAKVITTDPSKIELMKEWPVPKNIKELKGFLGLTGYYTRFIKIFATNSQPLTSLLKANAFEWNESAHKDF